MKLGIILRIEHKNGSSGLPIRYGKLVVRGIVANPDKLFQRILGVFYPI
jgi:hypothetical protein